jgi:hypothetical protein
LATGASDALAMRPVRNGCNVQNQVTVTNEISYWASGAFASTHGFAVVWSQANLTSGKDEIWRRTFGTLLCN